MSDDLVAFLRARLDEDFAAATDATPGPWSALHPELRHWGDEPNSELIGGGKPLALMNSEYRGPLNVDHIERHDPARILAEIEAKRQLIKRGDTLFCSCDESDPPMDPDTNWTVPIPHHYDCTAYRIAQVLATAYRDHPDYREEWMPFEWAPTD